MTIPPGIPDEAAALYRQLLDDDPVPHATLVSMLTEHVADINAAADQGQSVSTGRALELAALCRHLLEEAERRADDDARRHVQAAVNYFIRNDDGDPDLASPHGLDDDAQVCAAVARHLGRDDLLVGP